MLYLVCSVEVVQCLTNCKTNASDVFLPDKLHKRLDCYHLLRAASKEQRIL